MERWDGAEGGREQAQPSHNSSYACTEVAVASHLPQSLLSGFFDVQSCGNSHQVVHVADGLRRCMFSLEWLWCLPIPSSREATFTTHA